MMELDSQCGNCLELNQTITNLRRINENLTAGHDRLTLANEQLRKEIKEKQKN